MYKLTLGLLLLSLSNCTNKPSIGQPVLTENISSIEQPIIADNTPSISPTNPSDLANSNNHFACNLYTEVLKDKEYLNQNILLSPYSIAIAFAMLYLGSTEKTEKEFSEVFFWKGNSAKFHQSFYNLNKAIIGEQANENFQIHINNNLWISKNKGFTLLDSYTKESLLYYNQQVDSINFEDTPNAEKIINSWVNDKTKGKIPSLYNNNLSNDLAGLLVNTIYFLGKWEYPFEPELTVNKKFTTLENKKVEKKFMHQTFYKDKIGYIEDTNFKAIKLPYADKKTSLLIILPNKNFHEFAANFNIEKLNSILQTISIPYAIIKLELPKWKIETKFDLLTSMENLGISTSALKLDKMTHTPLAIKQITHKTFIEMDEYKTEAAAVTGIGAICGSAQYENAPIELEFKADKPFLYCIINEIEEEGSQNKISSILFMGQIVK